MEALFEDFLQNTGTPLFYNNSEKNKNDYSVLLLTGGNTESGMQCRGLDQMNLFILELIIILKAFNINKGRLLVYRG